MRIARLVFTADGNDASETGSDLEVEVLSEEDSDGDRVLVSLERTDGMRQTVGLNWREIHMLSDLLGKAGF